MAAKPVQKLTFKKDQFVVYPTHGVGKILKIEEQNIAGQKVELIVIEFEKNRMILRVPVEKAEVAGLRPLVTAKNMDEAIQSAKKSASAKRVIWSRRAQQYEEKINSGNPMELADVIRDLQRRDSTDIQTFSGRQIYMRALERMAQEFAAIHKIPVDDAEEKIEKILGVPKEIDLDAVGLDDEDGIDSSADEE